MQLAGNIFSNISATVNSNDIESMTVIKDAAAASLYGSVPVRWRVLPEENRNG